MAINQDSIKQTGHRAHPVSADPSVHYYGQGVTERLVKGT
jgi:hypothetical protein